MFSGLASGLYAREKTGKGSHVDVAMFDATLIFLEHGFMEVVAYGKPVHRIGNRHPFSRLSICSSRPTRTLPSVPEMTACSPSSARSLDGRISLPTPLPVEPAPHGESRRAQV